VNRYPGRNDDDPDYDDDRTDHERGVCDEFQCDDCIAADNARRKREERASRPGRGSRSARRRLDQQREMQRTRPKRCPSCGTIPTLECLENCVPF
jgi:hypothetical protein